MPLTPLRMHNFVSMSEKESIGAFLKGNYILFLIQPILIFSGYFPS